MNKLEIANRIADKIGFEGGIRNLFLSDIYGAMTCRGLTELEALQEMDIEKFIERYERLSAPQVWVDLSTGKRYIGNH